MVDDLFKSLDKEKGDWLEDIKHGDSSSPSFFACVEECVLSRVHTTNRIQCEFTDQFESTSNPL